MDALPSWIASPSAPPATQATTTPVPTPTPDPHSRTSLTLRTFEVIFPSVLERLAEGYTLDRIFQEDHRGLSAGAFMRWLKKDRERMALYDEAKELRTECWASRIVAIAEAHDNPLEDVARSKLKIDTYKYLMGADNRRTYGDTKTIDVGGTISIVGALRAANERFETLQVVEDVTPTVTSSLTPLIADHIIEQAVGSPAGEDSDE